MLLSAETPTGKLISTHIIMTTVTVTAVNLHDNFFIVLIQTPPFKNKLLSDYSLAQVYIFLKSEMPVLSDLTIKIYFLYNKINTVCNIYSVLS